MLHIQNGDDTLLFWKGFTFPILCCSVPRGASFPNHTLPTGAETLIYIVQAQAHSCAKWEIWLYDDKGEHQKN